MPRGGKRKGAGRPALQDSEKKQMVSFRLHPRMIAYLRASGSMTGTVERAVETSPRYKRWLEKQEASGR